MYYESTYWQRTIPCDDVPTIFRGFIIKCDLTLYTQICVYPREYDEKHFDETPDKDGPSFQVSYVSAKTYNTYRQLFECTVLIKHEFPKDTNIIDKRWNPQRMLKEKLANSDYSRITVDLGDRMHFSNLGLFKYYSFFRMARSDYNHVYHYDTYREVAFCYTLESELLFEFEKYTICVDYYYGYNCWFHCTDDYRKKCNCEDPKDYYEVVCDIECAEGFTYRLISYLLIDEREVLKSCDFVNPCNAIGFECEGVCLPVNNDSYLCEKPTYHFEYSDSKTRSILPNNIFFYGRTITIVVDNYSLTKGFYNLSDLIYINFMRDEEVFESRILQLMFHPTRFIPNSDITDVEFNFTMFFFFVAWDQMHKNVVLFKIYKIAEYVIILSKNSEEPITLYACLNETLECNGTSSPEYRAIYAWRMDSLNVSFLMGKDQYIPVLTQMGYYTFSCAIYTIIEDYKIPEVQNTSTSVQIRVYRDFGWDQKNNVLNYTQTITCSVSAYIPYELNISQMDGETMLKFYGTTVIFLNAHGGDFSFFCFLTTDMGHIFTRIHKFILRTNPTIVCFYPYTHILGAVIQCGHDGFIEDEYDILVSFYSYNLFYKLINEGYRYVKLPFNLKDDMYRIDCSIINKNVDDLRYNITVNSQFNTMTEKFYDVSNLTKQCTQYYKPIESLDVIKSSPTGFLVAQYVNDLVYVGMPDMYPSILTISFFILILIYLMCFIFLYIDFELTTIRQTFITKQYRYRITKRNMQIRLLEEVNKILDQNLDGKMFELFQYQGLFDDWDKVEDNFHMKSIKQSVKMRSTFKGLKSMNKKSAKSLHHKHEENLRFSKKSNIPHNLEIEMIDLPITNFVFENQSQPKGSETMSEALLFEEKK